MADTVRRPLKRSERFSGTQFRRVAQGDAAAAAKNVGGSRYFTAREADTRSTSTKTQSVAERTMVVDVKIRACL